MKISTKGKYAVRVLLDLAMRKNENYISLKDIAKRQQISKKYLDQIVSLLGKAGHLKTSRGYKGGYKLSKEPYEYNIYEILNVTEGNFEPYDPDEINNDNIVSAEESMEAQVWHDFYLHIKSYLSGISLQDVIDHSAAIEGFDYCIWSAFVAINGRFLYRLL